MQFKRLGKSIIGVALGAILVLGSLVPGSDAEAALIAMPPEPAAVIFHVNDVHGYFYQDSDVGSIGQDYIAALRDKTMDEVASTFLFSAGDMIQGNFFVNDGKGEAAVAIMNTVGYDGMVLGNHEFDYGVDRIRELSDMANFPMLAQTEFIGNEDVFQASVLIDRGDITLGVFGITTPETPRSSGGTEGLYFGTVDELLFFAQEMTDSLRSEGADIVVCLSHLGVEDVGFGTSYDVRDQVEGLDLIIDGHSHTAYGDIAQAEGKALIVSAGEYAQSIGCVEFYQTDDGYEPVEAVYDIAADVWIDITPKSSVTAVIDEWKVIAEEAGGEVIGVSPVAVNDSDRSLVRMQETMIGNLVADAIREAAQTDVAVMNGGSIRANLEEGDITVEEVNSILPYSNYIVKATVKGSVIKGMLEVGVSRYQEESGGFLQVSGMSFAFDPSKEAMSRVSDVIVGGVALDENADYTLATNDYLAGGGDGFDVLKEPFAQGTPIENGDLTNVLIMYLGNHQTDLAPKLEGRIVILDATGDDTPVTEEIPAQEVSTEQTDTIVSTQTDDTSDLDAMRTMTIIFVIITVILAVAVVVLGVMIIKRIKKK
jgi:5'-nucleotidase